MKYFIDFEATQFSNEIISVGCVREDGETFYSLVNVQRNKITPFITDLTGISKNDVEIVDFGMVDTSEKAYATAEKLQAANVDLIFCNMITYATSSVFAPIIREVNRPMVLVALQPLAALDYTKANTFMQLENDNICSVPEFIGVAVRMKRKIYDVIIGTLYDDAEAEAELSKWCKIANVLHSLKGARMGLMGHTMEAMYDMHADPTAVSAAFGLHVPLLEVDNVIDLSPMGCRTGFYFIVWGDVEPETIKVALINALKKVINSTEVPAANAIQCGNYRDLSLHGAIEYAKIVLEKFNS